MSAQALCPALTQALQAGRSQLNARVAEASRAQSGFDQAALNAFICGPLNALVAQAAALDASRCNGLVLAAFNAALALQLRDKHSQPLLQALWQQLLPTCLPVLLQQPKETLGSLINAALNLAAQPGVRAEEWLQRMLRHASQCADLPQLRGLGQVLAWRAGAAQYRSSALAVLRDFPAALAASVFEMTPAQSWPDVLQRLEAERWFDPANPGVHGLRVVHEVGGFSGWGGTCAAPPQAKNLGEHFVLQSAERYSYLCADAFGAVLLPSSAEEYAAAQEGQGNVRFDGAELIVQNQRCALDLPVGTVQTVCSADTLLAVSAYSHGVRVLALP